MSNLDATSNILLGVPDAPWAESLSAALIAVGHSVNSVPSTDEVLGAMVRERYQVVLLHASLPGRAGAGDLARQLLSEQIHPEMIMVADRPNLSHAVALVKAGAFDYLSTLATDALVEAITQALAVANGRNAPSPDRPQLDPLFNAFFVSDVPIVQEVASMARLVASRSDAHALIVGESGSGKRLLGRIIHGLSAKPGTPMVRVNVLDIAPEDIADRLFGSHNDDGHLNEAQGGTLLIQEIAELPSDVQVMLRHALGNQGYRTADQLVRFRGRVLATTEHDLAMMVQTREFDQQLYYRLAGVVIRLPSLRERAADLPRLAEAMLEQAARDAQRRPMRLTPDAIEVLNSYHWPGNLVELRKALTHIALLSMHDDVEGEELASVIGHAPPQQPQTSAPAKLTRPQRRKASSIPVPKISGIISASLDEASRMERARIEGALEQCGGHREKAAELLGMSRTTLWTRMRLLGIELDDFRSRKAR